jgi:hypothetical protein
MGDGRLQCSTKEKEDLCELCVLLWPTKAANQPDKVCPMNKETTNSTKRIHCVYFACDKHFHSLFLSLKSLARLRLPFIGTIYLFIDKDDFLTDAHSRLLSGLGLGLDIRKSKRMSCWGEEAVAVEANSFAEISGEKKPDDYLAKIDSDVLFVSGDTFSEVLRSGHDAFGHRVDYWEPIIFFQGGCYFIRGALLPEFKNFDFGICRKLTADLNATERGREPFHRDCCPDEGAIYYFLKTKTDNIAFKQFMVSQHDVFNPKKTFTTIHYVRSRAQITEFELFNATVIRSSLMKLGPFAGLAMVLARAMRRAGRGIGNADGSASK